MDQGVLAPLGVRLCVWWLLRLHRGGVRPMRSWKAGERVIAERLGGVRVPITGRQRGSAPDVAHQDLAIEVKTKATLPDWLTEAMEQAEASARGNQLPLAVIHENYRGYARALVVMRLADFEARFMENGRLRRAESQNLAPDVSAVSETA